MFDKSSSEDRKSFADLFGYLFKDNEKIKDVSYNILNKDRSFGESKNV